MKKQFLLYLLIIIAFSGCVEKIYVPQKVTIKKINCENTSDKKITEDFPLSKKIDYLLLTIEELKTCLKEQILEIEKYE